MKTEDILAFTEKEYRQALDKGYITGYEKGLDRGMEITLNAMKEPKDKKIYGVNMDYVKMTDMQGNIYRMVKENKPDPIREVYNRWKDIKPNEPHFMGPNPFWVKEMWNAIKKYCEGTND